MVRRIAISFLILTTSITLFAQTPSSYDSLKSRIMMLEADVNEINFNLEQSQRKFQSGILIATLGYTTTIAGGLMLGRENDEVGQALLVAGGITGVIGTYKMVNAFRFLTGRKKGKPKTNY
ncbi:hypothetical protein [Ekhidna sp.]|uniref:hypothetical protein n=1 Tax=Ekhidna sp. TaxID=2608089 RepID=UPI003B5AC868